MLPWTMKEDVIDDLSDGLISKKPKDNENEFRINRYIISYPFEGELKISQMKSTKMFPFLGVILFGGMGGFFGFLTVHYGIEEPFHPATIMCFFFSLFMLGLTSMVLVQHYATSRYWMFEKDAFFYKGLLWSEKTIARDNIESTFVTETITRTQGSSDVNYRYDVYLKVPSMSKYKKGYPICDVEIKSTWKNSFGVVDHSANDRAKSEARQICEVIAEHWQIPLSI